MLSQSRLKENQSSVFSEKYCDFIRISGLEEWKKTYQVHQKMNKKSLLFIMTDDTKNCDDVANYIRTSFHELRDSVLTIHTNKTGVISESTTGKQRGA